MTDDVIVPVRVPAARLVAGATVTVTVTIKVEAAPAPGQPPVAVASDVQFISPPKAPIDLDLD